MASTSTAILSTSTPELDVKLEPFIKGFAYCARSPILHNPSEVGLEYTDIHFPSTDGTVLEGWFIPASGSNKIIIANHPFTFNRSGFPSHIEPWKSAFGPGNDFELNFVPDYKILHDAGYNVLAYDFRNSGHSASANGNLQVGTKYEARDVLGSLAYVRSRPDLAGMKIGLFSKCMGANATFRAHTVDPKSFEGVACLVAPLLLSPHVAIEQALLAAGLSEYIDLVEEKKRLVVSDSSKSGSPKIWAPLVKMPTLTYGVLEDPVTRSEDLEGIFESLGASEKDMFWIEGTTRRWDGYAHFQREPKRVLDWFEKYMG